MADSLAPNFYFQKSSSVHPSQVSPEDLVAELVAARDRCEKATGARYRKIRLEWMPTSAQIAAAEAAGFLLSCGSTLRSRTGTRRSTKRSTRPKINRARPPSKTRRTRRYKAPWSSASARPTTRLARSPISRSSWAPEPPIWERIGDELFARDKLSNG
jgi:hypothetical protein